jgi:hypothetical protein
MDFGGLISNVVKVCKYIYKQHKELRHAKKRALKLNNTAAECHLAVMNMKLILEKQNSLLAKDKESFIQQFEKAINAMHAAILEAEGALNRALNTKSVTGWLLNGGKLRRDIDQAEADMQQACRTCDQALNVINASNVIDLMKRVTISAQPATQLAPPVATLEQLAAKDPDMKEVVETAKGTTVRTDEEEETEVYQMRGGKCVFFPFSFFL